MSPGVRRSLAKYYAARLGDNHPKARAYSGRAKAHDPGPAIVLDDVEHVAYQRERFGDGYLNRSARRRARCA